MGLFEQWKETAGKDRTEEEYNEFWSEYIQKEQKNYEYLLGNHDEVVSGKLSALAEKFGMDNMTFTGFLDGINTSLVTALELEKLDEESEIKLEIDFEKLYHNMLEAKADWLYNLPQWDDILSEEKRTEITKAFNRSKMAVSNKVGRNDPCPCGSGKKYKKCCGK